MAVIDQRLAQPGDDDLDLDIDGVTLTAVIVNGREVLVGMAGGFGRWMDTDGEEAEFRPGEPDEGVDYGDFHMSFPQASDRLFDYMITRLTTWRDQATPLHLCGAPGRMFTLIEDTNTWLPLPRRERPEERS